MNRSYSKIRHIQEANSRLEKRMLSEQEDDNLPFSMKRRLPELERLIHSEMAMNSFDDFKDEFEYADNIISWSVDAFLELPENEQYYEYYDEIVDYLKENYGEMIMNNYEDADDYDEDDDEFFDDDDNWE
jgi:hypothetical protein